MELNKKICNQEQNAIVYLIDDDQSILKALHLALTRKHFKVQALDSAESFLKLYDYNQPIFITGHGNVQQSVQAFKNGAIDFIEKPFDQTLLVSSIQDAIEKEIYRFVENTKFESFLTRKASLTPRELQIMDLFAMGHGNLTNKHIANHLDISHRTVEQHRQSLMYKMSADSITELIEMNLLYNQHRDMLVN